MARETGDHCDADPGDVFWRVDRVTAEERWRSGPPCNSTHRVAGHPWHKLVIIGPSVHRVCTTKGTPASPSFRTFRLAGSLGTNHTSTSDESTAFGGFLPGGTHHGVEEWQNTRRALCLLAGRSCIGWSDHQWNSDVRQCLAQSTSLVNDHGFRSQVSTGSPLSLAPHGCGGYPCSNRRSGRERGGCSCLWRAADASTIFSLALCADRAVAGHRVVLGTGG